MRYTTTAVAVAIALGGSVAFGPRSATAEEKQQAAEPQKLAQAETLTEGEIRKVDKEASKITIKHGPIANLDMPAMTMVFQIKDPALLEQVKKGDRVRFVADKVGGAYVVVRFETPK